MKEFLVADNFYDNDVHYDAHNDVQELSINQW